MEKLEKIGRKGVGHAIGFGWDGCHKIYVAETPEEVEELKDLCYTMYDMSQLESIFCISCPLRFISFDNLEKPNIVPQFAKRVTFTYRDGEKVRKSVRMF